MTPPWWLRSLEPAGPGPIHAKGRKLPRKERLRNPQPAPLALPSQSRFGCNMPQLQQSFHPSRFMCVDRRGVTASRTRQRDLFANCQPLIFLGGDDLHCENGRPRLGQGDWARRVPAVAAGALTQPTACPRPDQPGWVRFYAICARLPCGWISLRMVDHSDQT